MGGWEEAMAYREKNARLTEEVERLQAALAKVRDTHFTDEAGDAELVDVLQDIARAALKGGE